MIGTRIEWCDDTSNFVTGCNHGCEYCYARRMATRLGGVNGTTYQLLKQEVSDPFAPAFHMDAFVKLDKRLHSADKSRRVFIASMGDIGCKTFFHLTSKVGNVLSLKRSALTTGDVLSRVCELCRAHPWHTFLLLTKNPVMFKKFEWPNNVHIGTSIDCMDANMLARIGHLGEAKTSVRWVSIEPLLDPKFDPLYFELLPFLPDWIVIGGLSKGLLNAGCASSGKRIVDWCGEHGIPVFVKENLRRQFQGGTWPQEYP